MAEIGQLTERRLSLAAAAAERPKSGHRPPWMAYQAIDHHRLSALLRILAAVVDAGPKGVST
jgi:hypothetical protein